MPIACSTAAPVARGQPAVARGVVGVSDDDSDWGLQMHNSPQQSYVADAIKRVIVERPVDYLLAVSIGMLLGFIITVFAL